MPESETPIEVGDRFEDQDPREGVRVIQIVGIDATGRYRYITRVNDQAPWLATGLDGKRRGRPISAAQLRRRYRRVTR